MSGFDLRELRRRRLQRRAPEGPLRELLAVPWAKGSQDAREVPMLALDLETSGLDPTRHEIVSAGWVAIDLGRLRLESAERRIIRPRRELTADSVVIHGISDDAAAAGEPLEQVLTELWGRLRGRVLVAHHAELDAAFLGAACRQLFRAELALPCIDTLAVLASLSRRRQQPLPVGALSLQAARQRHGLPEYPAHDALWDAIAVGELWLAMLAELSGGKRLALGRVLKILP